ncbi:MAG TPA: zinc ABC transporter substrate-binding protein [Gammaproteobacteria bacterium]|nr:zinc ABC transporter substrate-binding protein [Gammaproteobacteria bacterium]HRP87480.1 zinc ABC transporter substrate-binding protein [Gammaproteobacteria bacterium]
MKAPKLLAAWLPALLLLSGPAAWGQAAPLQVVVSILPQQFLVERIAGPRVEVLTLVQPGDNEATYSPGPATLAALDGARVWFTLGVHFENAWLGRITRDRPGMQVVSLADGLPMRSTEQSLVAAGAADEHGHRHGGELDPHTWTDPRLAARMAGRIAETLARLDPGGADEYRRRAVRLQDELLALHEEIAARLAPVRGGAFIVFHPSWGYFADAYGLVQLPIEVGGREPGPRGLAEIIRRGREAGVRAVFVQQQFSQRSARAVAEALGVEVVEADPLAPDYVANLRQVSLRIAKALAAPGAGS